MKNLKIICLLLLMMASGRLSGQSFLKDLSIHPVVGIRNHTNGLPAIRTDRAPLLISSPMTGLEVRFGESPLSFSMQKDWNLEFLAYTEKSKTLGASVTQYWTENSLLLHYNTGKHYRVGVGYYFMYRESFSNFISSFDLVRKYNGVLLSLSRQFSDLDVEFRTKLTLDPIFAALGLSQHSLVFSYRFDGKSGGDLSKDERFASAFQLNALLGLRFFPISGVAVLQNEEFGKVGIAPAAGIELLHRKSGFSFSMEKDIWLSLNGGNPAREIKGAITNTFLAVKYHAGLKNRRYLRFGLGYSLVRDLDKMALLTYPSPYNIEDLGNFQVKGIGASLSYQLFRNADLEAKHTFPVRSVNEPLFNPIRFSLGVMYRIGL